jgi:hypothetical protein
VKGGSIGEQLSSNLGHRLALCIHGLDVVFVDAQLHLGRYFMGVSKLSTHGAR